MTSDLAKAVELYAVVHFTVIGSHFGWAKALDPSTRRGAR